MRNVTLILSLVLLMNALSAQIILTHGTHAIRPGDIQVMLKADYQDVGDGGADQIWNFSNLKIYAKEESYLGDKSHSEAADFFPNCNVSIGSSNGFFGFYSVDEFANEQWGYAGNTYRVNYSKPIRRLSYPMTYGNVYSGDFTGQGLYDFNDPKTTEIAGDYAVEADAYGTLILPNDTLENVLRIKTQTHKYEFMRCYYSEMHQVKYLYYSAQQRYPVFASMETFWVEQGKDTTWHRSSAVNELIVPHEKQNDYIIVAPEEDRSYVHSAYPNPFKEEFKTSFILEERTRVQIELFSVSGSRVAILCSPRWIDAGQYQIPYNASSLAPGPYLIRFTFNSKQYSQQLIKIR